MNWLNEHFAYPWVLPLAVVLAPLVWWGWRRPGRFASIRFSSLSLLPARNERTGARARHVLPVLRMLVVVLLVICIARPRKADEMTRVKTEGVAIELVVDRSGSMDLQDFLDPNQRYQSRLQVVKDVIKGFIQGDGDQLAGRRGDLIGLIAFGTYADTVCPLTWDHQHILRALGSLRVPLDQTETKTAIGDALLLAVERIRNIDRRFQESQDFNVTSRAIILLTDGEQNAGRHRPKEAAEAAKALGIKVYTIGALPVTRAEVFRGGSPIGEDTLRAVADMTGGKFFRATDASSLTDVYAEIDKLERTTVDEKRYYLYDELAFRWIDVGGVRLPPPLMVAMGLLVLEQLLGNTLLRRIP